MACIGALRHVLTVEPVLFATMFSYSSLTAIRVEYVKQAVGKLHNYSPHTSGSVCDVNKSDPNYILGEKVQSEASYWLLYFEVVSAVLTLFSGMLLGSYSERGGGRKTVLLVSVVGLALHVFCVLLVLILSLPIGYLFIAEIIRGVTGNTFTVMAMSFAFIADISSEKNRTIRMIILEAMLFVGGGVAQGATGGWIQSAGFIPPMWLIYGAFIATVFYVLVWLEETVRKQEISEWSISETCLDIVQLFSKASRETSIQLVIYNVCLFALFLIIGSNMSLTTLYMLDAPFCFTPVYVGYYLAIMFSANAVGMLAIGNTLSRWINDLTLAQLSFVSHAGSFLMVAFATNRIELLTAPAIGFLLSLSFPVLRSRSSKLCEPGKQGVMFALQGCIQGIGSCISPLIFNSVYSATVNVHNNLVFILYACILVIPIVLIGVTQVREHRTKSTIIQGQLPDVMEG